MRRILGIGLLTLVTALAMADTATIRLSSFPTVSVADGRSTVTVSAEVRDTNGKLVPNGTRIVFSTDVGSFRDPVVQTVNGIARSILVAPSKAGMATVTANAISFQATSTLDFEFVADRALLSSATDYIEIYAPKDLLYSMDLKIIGASGPGKEAVLRYRDVEIRASDLQVNVVSQEVRAREALLKLGREEYEFGELTFRLINRKGYGTTEYEADSYDIIPTGRAFKFHATGKRKVYGLREVSVAGLKAPTEVVPRSSFAFEEITDSASMISAKKAIAYPRREIQFHKAEVYVGGARVLRVPLFQVQVFGSNRVVMDDVFNVNNSGLAINYPHYLSLKPGQTSLLRLRTGQTYGRGLAANRGIFLDYELNWSKGEEMQGDVTVQGIGRNDWGITARQYLRIDDTTSANAQLELPSHQSLFGNVGVAKQFKGFSVNLNANASRSIQGTPFTGHQVTLNADTDPIQIPKLPIRFSYGLSAGTNRLSGTGTNYNQTSAGMTSRFFTPLLYVDKSTSFAADLSLSKLFGQNTAKGLTTMASASLSRRMGPESFLMLTYNFLDDGFTSGLTGRHLIGLRGSYAIGDLSMQGLASHGLDVDRTTYYLDASYRLTDAMRLSYSYTYNRFFGQGFYDYNFVLGYRLGFREFGLTWSHRTHRFGIQFLGTTIN